jgi:hypothetical protein
LSGLIGLPGPPRTSRKQPPRTDRPRKRVPAFSEQSGGRRETSPVAVRRRQFRSGTRSHRPVGTTGGRWLGPGGNAGDPSGGSVAKLLAAAPEVRDGEPAGNRWVAIRPGSDGAHPEESGGRRETSPVAARHRRFHSGTCSHRPVGTTSGRWLGPGGNAGDLSGGSVAKLLAAAAEVQGGEPAGNRWVVVRPG